MPSAMEVLQSLEVLRANLYTYPPEMLQAISEIMVPQEVEDVSETFYYYLSV